MKQREIKFRAWCHSYGMHYDIEAFDQNGGVCIGLQSDSWLSGILMQYTGLKDKNGVEIYEGDVLSKKRHKYQNNWASEMVHKPEYYSVVMFDDGCFITDDNMTVTDYIKDIGGIVTAEVIGNIYENPELLK